MIDGHQVCLALRTTYLSMHRKADAVLLPLGVTANQYVVLAALADEDGISQKALVQRIASDPNTIRPILGALEEKGFVSREASHSDGRVWEVKLTRKGRNAYTKISGNLTNFHQAVLSSLSNSEAETLLQLLGKVSDAINVSTDLGPSKPVKRRKRTAALAGRK